VRRFFRRWPVLAGVAGLAVLAATVAVVLSLPGDPPRTCRCDRPPVLSGVSGVPARWAADVSDGDAPAAWVLLTPRARARYRDVAGLRAALPRLAPVGSGRGAWIADTAAPVTQGQGTPTQVLYLLIGSSGMLRDAIVNHTMANGSADGRVDPDVTVFKMLAPAPGSVVGPHPQLQVGLAQPPRYAAIRSGVLVEGGTGIRNSSGYDEPFPFSGPGLAPGRTLIVATQYQSGRWSYGAVTVTVR
jgi:hypothetical protein